MCVREGVTFDHALEIVRIIFGIAFTNPKSGPDAAIMRIIAASNKCGLLWSRSDFTTK